ncbi:hypothetical protein M3A49_39270 [Paraburkholderia sp. CNPSo 3076]|uniref:hypothetical protein n=1 Tax=Paraburkholderia sp. CNPSo 3076 TaxID=2940936 RepID=UPI0022544F44|nr:hypothetical protein [Paraburkholderia sp. CNPSo 3076]MCX5545402.1 hypothetical protein [Paraburkholderia sp. CNPSo 3076]
MFKEYARAHDPVRGAGMPLISVQVTLKHLLDAFAADVKLHVPMDALNAYTA